MSRGPVASRNLSEKAAAIKRKRPKKAASRDIAAARFATKTGIVMSETQQTTPAAQAELKSAVEGLADAVRDAAIRRDRAGTFSAGLRAGLRRPRRRNRRDRARPGGAGFRQHHHRAGALRQTALEGCPRCSTIWFGAFQSGAARDRQGGVAADGAALEPDHDERGAVRPDRAAARKARHARR